VGYESWLERDLNRTLLSVVIWWLSALASDAACPRKNLELSGALACRVSWRPLRFVTIRLAARAGSGRRAGPPDAVAEVRHAEVGHAVTAGDLFHGLEFLVGCGQGGFQPGDLAEPAFAAGFGNAGLEVVADLCQPGLLAGVRAELRAPDTALTELILIG
jgi:hypothetical protein